MNIATSCRKIITLPRKAVNPRHSSNLPLLTILKEEAVSCSKVASRSAFVRIIGCAAICIKSGKYEPRRLTIMCPQKRIWGPEL